MTTFIALTALLLVLVALVAWARGDHFADHAPRTVDPGRPDRTWSEALGWR